MAPLLLSMDNVAPSMSTDVTAPDAMALSMAIVAFLNWFMCVGV